MTHRGAGFAVWGLVLALVVFGWTRLRFETDVLSLLPADLPTVRALERHQQHFATTHDLILTLRGKDSEAVAAAARSVSETLRRATNLVRRVVWIPPWEERPDLTAEMAAAAWLNAEPSAVEELGRRLQNGPLQEHLAQVRERLATSLSAMDLARGGYDPLALGDVPGTPLSGDEAEARFASEDGLYRIVFVTPLEGQRSYDRSIRWLKALRSEMEAWKASAPEAGGVRLRMTGGPAIAAETAEGMERDMVSSILGTAAVIGGLFWWAHRRWRPMWVILGLLVGVLGATLGVGGLIFGRINAVSLGFAAILLGLAVDYGLVLYQEARALGTGDAGEIRRRVGSGVIWSAVTTAAAFLTATFGGVPGLTQLGILVAVGTLIAAAVMLMFCVPPWMPVDTQGDGTTPSRLWRKGQRAWVRRLSVVGIGLAIAVLGTRGLPRLDHSAAPMRPLNSEAYAALDEMRTSLGGASRDPWWLIAEGADEREVAAKLRESEAILARTAADPGLDRWRLPTALWPDPDRQRTNRVRLASIGNDRERLRATLEAEGFTGESFRYASMLMDVWNRVEAGGGTFWPTNDVSTWVLSQVTARDADGAFALGVLRPGTNGAVPAVIGELRNAGVSVGGWDLLGEELIGRVEDRLRWVMVAMGGIWVACLVLALRSVRDVALAATSTAIAGVLLLAWMALAGWQWNLMNLMAWPVLLGTGTDYSIHMLLALRRHKGDLGAVRRGVGRALLLCMATTVAGFGSLAWSGNAGLASLGSTCAAGLICAYFVAGVLMPAWWRTPGSENSPVPDSHGNPGTGLTPRGGTPVEGGAPTSPSSLYHGGIWRVGVWIGRVTPRWFLSGAACVGGWAYGALMSSRRRVVVANLLPVLSGNAAAARRASWRLFGAFGRKLADLWIHESGRPVAGWFTELTGWKHLELARASGDGILLLTPHLGNWEFGAPLLAKHGIPLVVITQSEPGEGFTQMRQAARARWGVETVVIGKDAFAFIEVIKRLQSGAVVALLVDRPPPGSAVDVPLFGRPFPASIAGAELARATGCVLLPVLLPAVGRGYAAHVLPPIAYDRRSLGNRDARRGLTQDILRALEPHIRQHAHQWYHFVPVWPFPPDGSRSLSAHA